ncbi:MAG: sulfurtransferase [Acidobacteria bacterium]|nr:sulfurtransferase [Acidobacteriota bacterium]
MAQHSPRFLKIVEDAKHRIKEISAEELRRKLGTNSPLHILDVREADEYAKGRIPGAQHLCKGILERDIETAVPNLNEEIVLYCGGGFRSALAADNLQKMGYTNVFSLEGGWRDWSGGGYPTEQ